MTLGFSEPSTHSDAFFVMGFERECTESYWEGHNRAFEFFIGGGTMIVGFTGTAGWKHYYKNSKLSFYSVLSGQAVAHFGFAGLMPTGSFSLEYNLSEKTQVKIGGMGLMLLGGTSGESGSNIGLLPFIGLNFRF